MFFIKKSSLSKIYALTAPIAVKISSKRFCVSSNALTHLFSFCVFFSDSFLYLSK
nr:MAG TPA: hypothetical protein [Caudoviricetes sp.]